MSSNVIARISVSIGISASYTGDGCTVGVSITFRVDLYLIASVPSYRTPRINNEYEKPKRKTKAEFLSEMRNALNTLYDVWSKYLDRYKENQSLKIIQNQQELNEEILKVGKEQYRIRALVENIIFNIDEFMTNRKLDNSEIEQCYLLLSTAFQLIRDLSLTFCLGELSIRSSIDCSEKSEEISKKWLSRDDNVELKNLLKQRRDYSREIERLTELAIDNNNEYVFCSRKEDEIKNDIKSLSEKLSRTEHKGALSGNDNDSDEINHINIMIEIKNKRFNKYMDEKDSIQKEISRLGVFEFPKKKNLKKRLSEINNEINIIKRDIEQKQLKLKELDNKINNENESEINEIQRKIEIRKVELNDAQTKMKKYEYDVEKSSEEINDNMQKYEAVVNEIIKQEKNIDA